MMENLSSTWYGRGKKTAQLSRYNLPRMASRLFAPIAVAKKALFALLVTLARDGLVMPNVQFAIAHLSGLIIHLVIPQPVLATLSQLDGG